MNARDDLFDPAFFADESRSKVVLARRFANVLRLPGWRLPAADAREWVRNLEALAAGRIRADDKARVARVIGVALSDHAAAGPLTNWARAVGVVTVLAAIEGGSPAVNGMEPYLGGSGGDLLGPLAQAIGKYHDDAQEPPAGPLAFFWLMKAAAPFAVHFRSQATQTVCDYLDHRPADDRVRRFLLSPVGSSDLAARRDGTWLEWVCALFNGQRQAWSRDGILRAAALLLMVGVGTAGIAMWTIAQSRVAAFRASQIEPLRESLSK